MASMNIGDKLNDTTEKTRKAQGESLNAFLASLTTSAITCGLVVVIVSFLRWRCHGFYHPQRAPESASKLQLASFRPKMILFPMKDISIDEISRLENYLFERYLHTILRIFIPLALVLLPILIPLNVVNGKNELGGVRGLDRLSFANVGRNYTDRYWVHLVLAIFVVTFVYLVLRYELQYYSQLQQTMDHNQYGSSTVLLTSNSKESLSVANIKKHLDAFYRGVRVVRMNRDYRNLLTKINKRNKLIVKLEIVETNLIRKAISKQGTNPPKNLEQD